MSLVKIFTVDFYMSPPIQGLDAVYSDFRGSSIKQVPIIRIFGSTETGHKTCLHIHGVFPYIYIPFEGENSTSVIYQIAIKLELGLNIALGQASSNMQHIYKIVRVSGIPLYGYHSREHQFLKIYFYNPLFMKKACNLLQNGMQILGKIYQLHEAHIPFVLQFMIDYNLHGMNYISLSEIWYRTGSNTQQAGDTPERFLPPHINKMSTCYMEIDGLAEHIVNKLEVMGGQVGKNPGIAALWADEMQRRRDKGESLQISQCLSQDRIDVPPTSSHNSFREALKQRLLSQFNEDYKNDKIVSVYPAETPRVRNILRASFVESHSSANSSNPSYSMMSESIPDELDDTLCSFDKSNTSLNDTDAKDLLEILLDLGDNLNPEEDSILSQVTKHRDEIDEENEVDLSLPLASVITPVKIIEEANIENQENKLDIITKNTKSQVINDINTETSNREKCTDSVGPPDALKDLLDSNYAKDVNTSLSDTTSHLNHDHSSDFNKCSSIEDATERVKRKLGFTEIEENMGIKRINNTNKHLLNSAKDNSDVQQEQKSSQDSDELFSDEIKEVYENKTVNNSTLLIAEKYDNANNYITIAGPSKINFEETDPFKSLSGNSTTSGSDSIIIYQECSGKVTETGNSKSSGSITSHQEYSGKVAELHRKSPANNILNKLKLTQNLHILEESFIKKNAFLESPKYSTLMPKFNPPTRNMIQMSLKDYNIPEVRHQKPFYSDFTNVTGEVHIGHNVLKIEAASDFSEFECQATDQSLQQLRKLQLQKVYVDTEITQAKIKSLKLSFCENSSCFITTTKLPPTCEQVKLWLKVKELKTQQNTVEKKKKPKILVPYSPDGQNDSVDEDCISLSPFSPVYNLNKSIESEECINETPKSSLKSKKQKIMKTNKKLRSKNKITAVKSCENKNDKKDKHNNFSLYNELLQPQFLNNHPSSTETINDSGQITVATPNNTHGFKMSLENLQKAKTLSRHECLTTLVMELHIHTRGDLKPDPQLDSIRAIFYSLFNDVPENHKERCNISGLIASNISDDISLLEGSGITCELTRVDTETDLFREFIKLITKWDPDIFAGYEVEMLSWGYLVDRGYALGVNLPSSLARTQVKLNFADDEVFPGLRFAGRILLDAWRLMRHEVALQSYTFENIMYHVLHLRIPLYSFKDLSLWWEHRSSVYRHKTVNFYLCKVQGIIKLFNQLDLIGRTCELARLFGIQFYEVLSRGSQFRVESMMLRLAKPLNYISVSPSVQQRAKMKAPEHLPLILEPESKFFADPVIVLDFQSLYPSMIIAYNYCFSTCLGRVEHLGKNMPFEFGATQLRIPKRKIKQLFTKNLINFSPCGVAFVKKKVRQGILPRMLLEILDTRLMVKKSMKQNKDDKILQRVLQSRQLGLKLIANVTYGYTAANFSGRMPAVEIADSVVSKGRETLLCAIKLIENTSKWAAKVVYGDTDSVFVLVPGRSREDAFKIGAEIAEAVTNNNPSPVKLKLEKVYHPCILQTKKRYVGYMYESSDQKEPEFDAKGIETVRRDGCPAVSKMLEKSLKILFDTRDVSLVRNYVLRQFTKLLSGKISLQDLTFAKEYRGASSYRPGACVPALELTRKWIAADKRSEPRCGERVPYVIVNGPPGLPLIRLVRSPKELLLDSSLFPNITYYITKAIIPPLNRCFTLIGANLSIWFNNMPRKQLSFLNNVTPDSSNKKGAISHYFATASCIACGQKTHKQLCTECCDSPQETVVILQNNIRIWERNFHEIKRICDSCAGHSTNMDCISLDCPVLYQILKANRDLQQITQVKQVTLTALGLEL